ncbi:UNVERIFIED_CONTAM: hypothetical protein Sradi_7262300 [Sesamum radiatum]|uniref:Uncharacterized protein n=1 Tax=Sesamum radiatum TaxID=300843 RepID=A0AAW2IJC6_SESRA
MHHPERVFRQFGMVQDRRGRHGEDWASFHRDYIVKWNDVQSMLVVRPEIVNGRGTVPDYMNGITKLHVLVVDPFHLVSTSKHICIVLGELGPPDYAQVQCQRDPNTLPHTMAQTSLDMSFYMLEYYNIEE